MAASGTQPETPSDELLLDAETILARLPPEARQRIGPLWRFDTIDSTNAWLLAQAEQGADSGTCVLAEHQSAGRGRRGRTWYSPFGANLYLSLLWRFDAGAAALATLSLAAGVAIAEALVTLGVAQPTLKWPNDIHYQGRKLGGLLIEIAGERQGPSRAVLGLGLNLHMPAGTGARIDQPWIDLADILQADLPNRNTIAALCIDRLSAMLAAFPETDPADLLDAWRRFDGYRDRPADLQFGTQSIAGIYRGIDAQGALVLETDAGERRFSAGEIRFRPT